MLLRWPGGRSTAVGIHPPQFVDDSSVGLDRDVQPCLVEHPDKRVVCECEIRDAGIAFNLPERAELMGRLEARPGRPDPVRLE
ncbi:hypothetical protein NPS01_28290 [Nocardioides psychrotolerans]|uniref:Uncharacterized protein n=1 Tax=Nocardioides psychrotolerans TaxID=1005945 RepID=A0A1I3ESF7_9ACTN|nr:hypothetical protein [Nocardioides psychrotolerans]GEP39166.1 hypothetical protein NPS01_28290 [Nocardioides psychrotolerans]SFI01882.1 hypothetical protein SAMN05216561_10441 [Nocardioides psychrotolerans]